MNAAERRAVADEASELYVEIVQKFGVDDSIALVAAAIPTLIDDVRKAAANVPSMDARPKPYNPSREPR